MPALFAPSITPNATMSRGVASLVSMVGLQVARIRLGDPRDPLRWPDSPSEIRAVLTDFSQLDRVLAQIEPSLGEDIYVWSAGDAQTQLRISGVAVYETCQNFNPGQVRHGFSRVYDFYLNNRLSQRRTPIVIQVGDRAANGRLLGIELNGQGASNLVPFSLNFILSPPPIIAEAEIP